MKVILNPTEVNQALVKYVRDQYLIAHEQFEVEVLDIMDGDDIPIEVDCEIKVELGVSKKKCTAAPVAPAPTCAPVANY